MQIAQSDYPIPSTCPKRQPSLRFLRTALALGRTAILLLFGVGLIGSVQVLAQDNSFVLDRDGGTIFLEPYAPNIVRITLSKTRATATASPGYGFVGTPSPAGWVHERDTDGYDVFRSGRLVVHVSPSHLAESRLPHPMPLDDLNQSLRDHYFGGGPRNGPNEDTV